MFKHKTFFAVASVLLLVGLAATPIAAQFTTAEPEKHCVVQIEPLQPGQEASVMSEPVCFDSSEAAMQFIGANPDDFRPDLAGENVAPPTDQPADLGTAPNKGHCVVLIEPIKPGQEESVTSAPVCFDSFADAIYAATEGAVRLDPTIRPNEITQEMLSLSQRSTVVGIDWKDKNFRGDSYVWATYHTPGCSDGSSYGVSSMPSGWNDVVSSAKSYAGCNHYYHYEHTNWIEPRIDCGGECAQMYSMDNKTSSERWTQ